LVKNPPDRRSYSAVSKHHSRTLIATLLYTKRKDELSYLRNSWVDLASQTIKPYISVEKSKQLNFNHNMVFSVILISGLLAGPPEDYSWIDLNDTDERRALMDYAIQ